MPQVVIVGSLKDEMLLNLAKEALKRGFTPIVLGPSETSHVSIDGTDVACINMENDADLRETPPKYTDNIAKAVAELGAMPSRDVEYVFYNPPINTLANAKDFPAIQEQISARSDAIQELFVDAFLAIQQRAFQFIKFGCPQMLDEFVNPNGLGMVERTRRLHGKIECAVPGSRSLIVHPRGLTVPFEFKKRDPRKRLDLPTLASMVWSEVLTEETGYPSFREVQVHRTEDGQHHLTHGPVSASV